MKSSIDLALPLSGRRSKEDSLLAQGNVLVVSNQNFWTLKQNLNTSFAIVYCGNVSGYSDLHVHVAKNRVIQKPALSHTPEVVLAGKFSSGSLAGRCFIRARAEEHRWILEHGTCRMFLTLL